MIKLFPVWLSIHSLHSLVDNLLHLWQKLLKNVPSIYIFYIGISFEKHNETIQHETEHYNSINMYYGPYFVVEESLAENFQNIQFV